MKKAACCTFVMKMAKMKMKLAEMTFYKGNVKFLSDGFVVAAPDRIQRLAQHRLVLHFLRE